MRACKCSVAYELRDDALKLLLDFARGEPGDLDEVHAVALWTPGVLYNHKYTATTSCIGVPLRSGRISLKFTILQIRKMSSIL